MLARNSGGLCGSTVSSCSCELLAALGAPDVRPVQEQPLRAGEAVDDRGLRAVEAELR